MKCERLRKIKILILTNAFTERISDDTFNFFLLLVIDLLHEFELGVWKAIFTHLLRILSAEGGSAVERLNYRCVTSVPELFHLSMRTYITRYRRVSTFGRGTIRKFARNASSMKRLAARDFEDLLQVCTLVSDPISPCMRRKNSARCPALKAFCLRLTTR